LRAIGGRVPTFGLTVDGLSLAEAAEVDQLLEALRVL
jgi:hypothetical protein